MSRVLASVIATVMVLAAVAGVTASAEPIGSQVRISQAGPDGNDAFDGSNSSVAFNPQTNQYLVVWQADDSTNDEFEIFGRFVSSEGAPVGGEFRVSDMGPDGNAGFGGFRPDVAYNSQANEFLVVWDSDDNTAPLVDNESEIFGQRLNAAGGEVGANDFRISDAGPDGNAAFGATESTVAYNSQANEYLVAWSADDVTDNEFEIYGQRLNAAGAEVGVNDFLVSDMGPNANNVFAALSPAAAYNSQTSQFLVVWEGDDDTAPLTNDEFEIYGQLIGSGGNEIGPNDLRISNTGPDGNANFDAIDADVAYGSQPNEFLVVWRADDDTPPFVDNEYEVFGQRVNAAGAEVGTNDFRISEVGPDGSAKFGGFRPAVAYSGAQNEYQVLWYGDDKAGALVDNEWEIFGQRITAAGAVVGANDFRVSQMGPNGDQDFDALAPAVAYGSRLNQYLATWQGDDDASPAVDNENEVYGRRLSATGAAADRKRPRLKLKYGKLQRLLGQKAIVVRASANERVSWLGTARLSISGAKLGRLRHAGNANQRRAFRFKLSRKALGKVKAALAKGKRVTARCTFRATDPDGNSTSKRISIRGKR